MPSGVGLIQFERVSSNVVGKSLTLAVFDTGGAPNRPLPPTPDEEELGDRTLVMKRVSRARPHLALLLNDSWSIMRRCSKIHDNAVFLIISMYIELANVDESQDLVSF